MKLLYICAESHCWELRGITDKIGRCHVDGPENRIRDANGFRHEGSLFLYFSFVANFRVFSDKTGRKVIFLVFSYVKCANIEKSVLNKVQMFWRFCGTL